MNEVYKPGPESVRAVAIAGQPLEQRKLYAKITEIQQPKREHHLIAYPMLPLLERTEQVQEESGDESVWDLLVMFIGALASVPLEQMGNEIKKTE